MKKYLMIGLFLSVGAQASNYYQPALYGNALSGYYNACFSSTPAVPLYTQLLQPPAWSSTFANNGGTPGYDLDAVFATSSWVNSGITQYQYIPKGGTALTTLLDSAATTFTNNALLGGTGTWSINESNLGTYITNNSTTGDLAYYNAATIEYFSARMAMAASAFLASNVGTTNQNSFLNVLYPSATWGKTAAKESAALQEQTILTNFVTAAENLFSWSRYLRNLMIPDSISLPTSNTNSTVTQANGFTLGALETFVGLIVINNLTSAYGIQQVVIPSGQTPTQPSAVPSSALTTATRIKPGLINPLTYPININAPSSDQALRFTYPGRTSFSVKNIYFLPVATQVYAIGAGGSNFYAVQEPADNWANAPVATSGSYFRQVAFQCTVNGQISPAVLPIVIGVGVTGATSAATTSPMITLGQPTSTSGYNKNFNPNAGTYTPLTVDNLTPQTISFATNFFEDKQPWAVVVSFIAGVPAVTGVVKLNSFDFPLMFAQDPLAQGYQAAKKPVTGKMPDASTAGKTTYGVNKKPFGFLPKNSLLPESMSNSSVSLQNSVGIAFSQRDVWRGISNLYALTLQANLEKKDVGASYNSLNYSFAYMFLQALFNGHLYSTTANSLYSVMQSKNEIKGAVQDSITTSGVIGNLAYDYVTEHPSLPLYPLPASASGKINITASTPKAKGIWPINEARKEPAMSDWLQPGTPLDWLFLRALMVGRALMENTGITAAALPSLQAIMNASVPATNGSTSSSVTIPGYISQTNTVVLSTPNSN